MTTTIDDGLSKILNYLYGESDYDGAWFGEIPKGKTGMYWWRRELKQAILNWHNKELERAVIKARVNEAIDRIEVIDETGRAYVRGSIYGTPVSIKLDYQDNGKTLKIFVEPKQEN